MSGRVFGRRIPRNEDPRLLRGEALFVDDVPLPGVLHAAFVRSPVARGRVVGVDASPARELPDVEAVFTSADLGGLGGPLPLLVPPPPVEDVVFHERTQLPLAREAVRHAGEPVALVVARSRYAAEDAAEAVRLEIEEGRPVVELEAALEPDAPLVHPDLGSNLAARCRQTRGDYGAARARADLVIGRRYRYDRGVSAAIENRGVAARWEPRSGELEVWDTTQAPIPIRNGLAGMLGLSESRVRVVAPHIGGGFGPKIMMFYPEEVLVPWAAMRLERPVKWIEDRYENFFATTQEREQIHEAEMALDREGRILGVKDEFLHDTGAYDPYGLTVPINSQCTLLGPYRVPSYESEFRVAFTNKPIVTPVRGAGRQHGVFVMERLLDAAARELGVDRVEIRRRNYLEPDDFPHAHGILYQDFSELVYDSGDYAAALEQAVDRIGYPAAGRDGNGARARGEGGSPAGDRSGAGRQGKGGRATRTGVGVVSYVEGTGVGPYEGARVRVESTGKVSVATGVGTQGQGHATAFAQVVAESLGVEVRDVRVVTGDTGAFHWGTGTFASRGAVVAGNACHAAAEAVREKALAHAAEVLEADEADLELADGGVRVRGAPDRRVDLGELALRANPLRGAVAPDAEPGLEATRYFGPDRATTASGVHAMVVAVDPETLDVEILRYVVVHDCGRVINQTLVEGQIHGGVAMGIGNAFYEELVFDDSGQILNATFMDYLLPTASDVPRIEVGHVETPSPLNPLGTKGVGEAGAIPVGALLAQAVEDAFSDLELEVTEIPLSPARLYELVEAARRAGKGAADGAVRTTERDGEGEEGRESP